MALPGVAVSHRDHVLLADDVFAKGQFQDQGLVQRGDRGKADSVEALCRREPRLLGKTVCPLFA